MFYEILRVILIIYFRAFHSLEITGKEHIPADGPVILCANHSSYFDSMLVGLCTGRKVRFIIYDVFYHHRLLGPFIRAMNSIPVRADGINKEALKKSLAVLKGGGVIGIFPEGRLTRTGLPGPAEPGAALLAAAGKAPIVPITISGAYSVYPKGSSIPKLSGKITVMVHSPVKIEQTRRREEGYLQNVTDQVMGIIAGSLKFPNP
jgi:1-acyl-sn-glycerol-3-phosphate acyltransferase